MTEQQITVTKIEPHPVDGWFVHTEGGRRLFFATDEVRAMGLTLPAPALTITINGHEATINRDDAEKFARDWIDRMPEYAGRAAVALANLIRTALDET